MVTRQLRLGVCVTLLVCLALLFDVARSATVRSSIVIEEDGAKKPPRSQRRGRFPAPTAPSAPKVPIIINPNVTWPATPHPAVTWPPPETPQPPAATPQPPTAPPTSHTFTILNNCTETIWVASLANPGFQTIANGGFVMAQAGPPVQLQIPIGWQGRFWARIGCNFTESGDCDPPYQPCCASGSCLQANGKFGLYCADSGVAPTSLIEMSLDNSSPVGPYDVYDTSLVDGWSVPLSITPIEGTYNPTPDPGVTAPWCKLSGCFAAPQCPAHLAVNGTSLSCWSPCQAAVNAGKATHFVERVCCVCTLTDPSCDCASTNNPWSDEYGCCEGGFGCTPYHNPPYDSDTICNPWSKDWGRGWPDEDLQYIDVVRGACSGVYAWQFDDRAATFQCRATNSLVDYQITFVTRFRGTQGDVEKQP